MPTGISYADEVWNVCVGCTPIKSGCLHCWAERLHNMRHNAWLAKLGGWTDCPKQYHKSFAEVQLLPDRLKQPLHWRKPRTIFVNSMGDTFHKDVPFEFIDQMFAVASVREQHKYLFFTKRWARALEYFSGDYKERVGKAALAYISPLLAEEAVAYWREPFLPNVHLYFSASTQDEADEAWQHLKDIPVAFKGFSFEPLLEDIYIPQTLSRHGFGYGFDQKPGRLNSIIVGCESLGHGKLGRACELSWIEDIVRHCECAEPNISAYVKQIPIDGKCVPLKEDNRAIWPSWAVQELPK